MFDALIREVKEEAGLDITYATGQENYVKTEYTLIHETECFRPYAVYQTTKGPFDSMGFYFKCKAEGELLSAGDDSCDIKWITLDELKALLETDFSDIDRAAALYYLRENSWSDAKL